MSQTTDARLAELAAWPGDIDIPKVSEWALDQARIIIDVTNTEPNIFPTPDGTIQLEWHKSDSNGSYTDSVEIELLPEMHSEMCNGTVFVFDMKRMMPNGGKEVPGTNER